jgi:hypothetical protein
MVSNNNADNCIHICLGEFLLVLCGRTGQVELVSLDPTNDPVPDRYQNLSNFPDYTSHLVIWGATFISDKGM